MVDILSETRPDWFFNPNTKNGIAANFICISSGLDASINDSSVSITLSSKPDLTPYDSDDVNSFAAECEYLLDVYCNNTKPSERIRIGFRQFYEAKFDNEELSRQWVLSLGLMPVNPLIVNVFDAEISAIEYVLVLKGRSHNTRIVVESALKPALVDRGESLATVRSHVLSEKQNQVLLQAERKGSWIKRNRSNIAMVDMDCYIEFPTDDVIVGEFIKKCHRESFAKFSEVIVGEKS